jgi:hypothetical protein
MSTLCVYIQNNENKEVISADLKGVSLTEVTIKKAGKIFRGPCLVMWLSFPWRAEMKC